MENKENSPNGQPVDLSPIISGVSKAIIAQFIEEQKTNVECVHVKYYPQNTKMSTLCIDGKYIPPQNADAVAKFMPSVTREANAMGFTEIRCVEMIVKVNVFELYVYGVQDGDNRKIELPLTVLMQA